MLRYGFAPTPRLSLFAVLTRNAAASHRASQHAPAGFLRRFWGSSLLLLPRRPFRRRAAPRRTRRFFNAARVLARRWFRRAAFSPPLLHAARHAACCALRNICRRHAAAPRFACRALPRCSCARSRCVAAPPGTTRWLCLSRNAPRRAPLRRRASRRRALPLLRRAACCAAATRCCGTCRLGFRCLVSPLLPPTTYKLLFSLQGFWLGSGFCGFFITTVRIHAALLCSTCACHHISS